MVALWGATLSPARADDPKEYLIKAAFIYNFVKFTEWPGDLAVSKQSNLNICVVGSNPFVGGATEVFKKASTAQLKLSVVEGTKGTCHILFISRSEASRVDQYLNAGGPILTVSDIEGFADRGGMIGFVLQDNKIKLVVNTKAATAAGLRIDAQLLEIALRVIR